MAYDPRRGVVVLYGGDYGSGSLGDTWEWDGDDWTQVFPVQSPFPLHAVGMTWHGGPNPCVLLQGGVMNGGASIGTWSYDGTTWTQLPHGPQGTSSLGSALVYVPSLQATCALVTYTSASGMTCNLVSWNGSSWQYSNNQVLAPLWGNGWFGHQLALQRSGGIDRIVAFADNGVMTIVPTSTTQVAFLVGPSSGPRLRNAVGGYDTVRGSTTVFGGETLVPFGAWTPTGDLLQTNAAGDLGLVNPSPPPSQRLYTDMAFDPALDRSVLFGGLHQGQTLGDTWSFDGDAWTNHGSNLGASPRVLPALAPYAGLGTVMFGGATAIGGAYLDDTYVWNGVTWTILFTLARPAARYGHDLAATSGQNRIYLFGGYNGQRLADTWQLGPTGWNQVFTIQSPPARNSHRMAYDERRGRLVLFGGQGAGNAFLGDTWELVPGPSPTWVQRTTVAAPSPRWNHMMDYDRSRAVVVLHGGYGAAGFCRDTWEYDGSGWRLRIPSAPPAAREGAGFSWQANRQRFVLQGGHDGTAGMPNETWLYGAPVDTLGVGTPGNPRRLVHRTYPLAGGSFRVNYANPSGFGWLLVDPTPTNVGNALPSLGLFCSSLVLFADDYVVADAMGDPAQVSFQLPLALAGSAFTCQGLPLSPNFCFELTDALLVTPQSR
jgi:hypothetical protein